MREGKVQEFGSHQSLKDTITYLQNPSAPNFKQNKQVVNQFLSIADVLNMSPEMIE